MAPLRGCDPAEAVGMKVAGFYNFEPNCKIQQPLSPAFGNIKAQKGPYMKSTLADFTDGVYHDN